MNLDEKIARELAEKIAEARAYRIATQAAEEFIRCNGMKTDCADEFVFHGAIWQTIIFRIALRI